MLSPVCRAIRTAAGGCRELPSKRGCNRREHGRHVFEHGAVLEADHADAYRGEVLLALQIVGALPRCEVDGAIEFDGQPLGGAVEVEDVGADAVLAAEAPPGELAPLEVPPQDGLGGRAVGAQVLPEGFVAWPVVGVAGHGGGFPVRDQTRDAEAV